MLARLTVATSAFLPQVEVIGDDGQMYFQSQKEVNRCSANLVFAKPQHYYISVHSQGGGGGGAFDFKIQRTKPEVCKVGQIVRFTLDNEFDAYPIELDFKTLNYYRISTEKDSGLGYVFDHRSSKEEKRIFRRLDRSVLFVPSPRGRYRFWFTGSAGSHAIKIDPLEFPDLTK